MIFDFCLLVLGAILSFSLGVALSVWLSETCKKFEDKTNNSKYFTDIFILGFFVLNFFKNNYRCSLQYITSVDDSDIRVFFYTCLHRAEVSIHL